MYRLERISEAKTLLWTHKILKRRFTKRTNHQKDWAILGIHEHPFVRQQQNSSCAWIERRGGQRDGVDGVVGRRQQQNPAESAHTNIVDTVGQLVHVMQSIQWQFEWCTLNGTTIVQQQWKYNNGDTTMEIQQRRHSSGVAAMEFTEFYGKNVFHGSRWYVPGPQR